MIEIIPNWHPLFVHFTVALFSTAVGFYWLSYINAQVRILKPAFTAEFEAVARWCLCVFALTDVATVLAGFYAYNTVQHDAISHSAMTDHRNWALPTATAIIIVAFWSGSRYLKQKKITVGFLLILSIVQCLLLSTAWRGAELVFRYGLGVISLPKAEGTGHQHHHENGNHQMPTNNNSASLSTLQQTIPLTSITAPTEHNETTDDHHND